MTDNIDPKARREFEDSKGYRKDRAEKPFAEKTFLEKALKAGVYSTVASAGIAAVVGLSTLSTTAYHRFVDRPKIEAEKENNLVKLNYILLEHLYSDMESSHETAKKYQRLSSFRKKFKDRESLEMARKFEVSWEYMNNHFLGLDNRIEDLREIQDEEALSEYLNSVHTFTNLSDLVDSKRKAFVEVLGGDYKNDLLAEERKDVEKDELHIKMASQFYSMNDPKGGLKSAREDYYGDLIISWLKACRMVTEFDMEYDLINEKAEKQLRLCTESERQCEKEVLLAEKGKNDWKRSDYPQAYQHYLDTIDRLMEYYNSFAGGCDEK